MSQIKYKQLYPSYFSRSDDQDDDEQMVGGGRENDRGGTKRPSDDFEVYNNTEDPPRKNRPAGYGGSKNDTPTDNNLAKTYSLNNLIATNGLVKKSENFDSLLSEMANISIEDLDKIRKELIKRKETQHLTGTMTANNGRQIKRPAPEVLVSTLFYVVSCSLASWETGKEITHHRLTL